MQLQTPLLCAFALSACQPADDPQTTDDADPTATGATTDPTTGTPPVCGNGLLEPGEECDDGNLESDDACLNSCTSATCGDGIVQDGVEQCDDGDLLGTNACTAACTRATCGDGIVWDGAEQCDDGNTLDNDHCTAQCRHAACGDGVEQPGEACDDGPDNVPAPWAHPKECTTACELACGDGTRSAFEACDDGDRDDADGCDAACEDEYPIFVTRGLHPADFGGVAAADAICQAAATGKLTGTYVAWLSSTAPHAPAHTDLPLGHPLIRTDGAPVVADAGDLLWQPMFALESPIDRDEHGNPVGGYTWTGTAIDGKDSGLDCDGWTSTGSDVHGQLGSTASTGLAWTSASWIAPSDQVRCTALNRLYCFRKADP